MGRYLMFFQYIGTKYCGVVKASHPATALARQTDGVQDVLERALETLRPVDPVKLHVSSRTDAGVHALCNTAHFDLQLRTRKSGALRDIPSDSIKLAVNRQLKHQDVRVLRIMKVADNFHSQYLAARRTYLYRIAAGCGQLDLPVFEQDRCWAVKYSLDIQSMVEASKYFLGTHDFSAFRSALRDSDKKNPVKTMESIDIKQTEGFLAQHYGMSEPLAFWEITFSSKSFLYRQIRRMTGALVAAGLGQIAPSDIPIILASRDNSHMHHTVMAPACGLYLKEVLYNESDLVEQEPDTAVT